jgi:hypothetical protein
VNQHKDLRQTTGRDIDSKPPNGNRLKYMVTGTATPHSYFLFKTYMLCTGLGLKPGLLDPWHSVLIVKLVSTLEAWQRETITKVGKTFAV